MYFYRAGRFLSVSLKALGCWNPRPAGVCKLQYVFLHNSSFFAYLPNFNPPSSPLIHTHIHLIYCITLWVFLPARFKAVKEVQFYVQYLFDPISGLSGSNFEQLFCVLLKREGIQYDATLLKIMDIR
jgi:hypothetical protein